MDEKEVIEQAQKALNLIRDEHKKLEAGKVSKEDFKAFSDKLEPVFEKQEKMAQDALAISKKNEKFEQDLLNLETKFMQGAGSNQKADYKNTEHYKAYKTFLQNGDARQYEAIATKQLNRTDIMVDGGFLVPEEMSTELLRDITEISPLRRLARTMTINARSITIPKRRKLLTANYEGETETQGTSNSTYGDERLTPYALAVTVPATWDLLKNVPSFENEIMIDVAEAFAQAEGNAFLNGDGNKKPEGILVNAAVNSQALISTQSGAVAFDDLINVTGRLKSGYNGMYTFNRTTNATLRTLKGTDGHYLWQMQSDGELNTLNGFNYMLDNQMPNIAAGAIPILFADFAKGYRIVNGSDTMVIRDDYTQKSNRIVEFAFSIWNTGKVVLPEAIQSIKVKA